MQKRIYEASTETLLDIIRNIDDSFASAMLIGHNPSMTWLTEQLSGAPVANMPTCAVATLKLASNHWNEAGSASAELIALDFPKNRS